MLSRYEFLGRAVSLLYHETPKEQRGKRNLLWQQAQMGEKLHPTPRMLINVISWENWQSSEWNASAEHIADQHRNLKESRLNGQLSSGEGSSTEGTS